MRGFSGVDTPLAGVAATEEGDVLSKVPAGILALEVKNSPNKNFIGDRNKSVQSCEGESRLLLAHRAVYW